MSNERSENKRSTGDPWSELLHRIWVAVDVGPECVDAACEKCRVIPDIFGTGDSPEHYECQADSASDCARLFEDACRIGRIAEVLFFRGVDEK